MTADKVLAEVRKKLMELILQGNGEVFHIVEFIDQNGDS